MSALPYTLQATWHCVKRSALVAASVESLISLGAVAAPALIAKLTGARTWFALVGSALGFASGALFAKAFDKFGIFLAPALHAGATAILSVLGDRAR